MVAVIPPEDLPTTYEYHNGFVRVVNRGPAKWIYWRNEQGDITEQVDPQGNSTFYRYNPQGLGDITEQVDPQGNSTFYRYNPQGRLLEIRHPDGSLHQLGWNNLGQLLEERLPNGGQRKYRYDELGRQITRQEETGAITQYQWDAANRLANVIGGASRAFS
ncbi:hypothetical protein AO391_25100 [Pseudomonas marginalis ICMP 9505]|nr:hypothetical protein AO391_25100 [Pseudomonas marginalis ICMP 9505]